MRIDSHAHFIPRDCFDMKDPTGRPFGPTIRRAPSGQEVIVANDFDLGPLVAEVSDPETRIRDMDRMGIDMQALSINPSSIFDTLESGLATALYRRYNDAIAQVVRAYPDRFLGIATVPMQDVPAAVSELERAIKVLGLHGVQVGSNVKGKNLDDREFVPFYRKAELLGIPIFLHAYKVAAPERLQNYWLENTVGNPIETAIAIGSLVFGRVIHDFPKLKWIVGHGGGAAPFIVGRWSHGYQHVEVCHSIPEPPETYVRTLYFDSLTHSDLARGYLVSLAGADHVVLGSDYPFAMGDSDPIGSVRNATTISEVDKTTIVERSAGALYKLP